MLFKHIVLIAIGIANVSALDTVHLNDEVTSMVEEAPRSTNLRGGVIDTTAILDDSDVDTVERDLEEEEEEEEGAVDWLAAAHRMLAKKKKKTKLTAAQKALKKLKNKNKNNGKKNGNNNNNNNNNGGGSSTRAECTDRGNKKWCLNEWQPLDGTCKWANKKCSKQRADCVDRGNVNWCTNEVSAWRRIDYVMYEYDMFI